MIRLINFVELKASFESGKVKLTLKDPLKNGISEAGNAFIGSNMYQQPMMEKK